MSGARLQQETMFYHNIIFRNIKAFSSYLNVVNIIVLFFCLIYLHESYNKIEVLPIFKDKYLHV